jgi:hypothetical protein
MSTLMPAIGDGAHAAGLQKGYNDMYNLAFDSAHRRFKDLQKTNPDDPFIPVSDAAAYLFAEFDRLRILQSEFFVNNDSFFHKKVVPDAEVKKKFDADLDETQKLADAKLRTFPNDQNALFASVLRLGLRADYLALIEKRYLASLDDVKESRKIAEHLLQVCPTCYDAYLAAGVENYLLSLKPAPVRWFLRAGGAQTDKEEGIKNLRLAAAKGNYLQPYAQLLLAVAALRDKKPQDAKQILLDLTTRFPQNQLYREELKKISPKS